MPPVSNTHLTDLATLKLWLKIGVGDVLNDATLTRLIPVISSTIKQLINRPLFITGNYSERYSGIGSNRLFLNAQPVTAIASVTFNGQILQPMTTPYQGGYRFDKYGIIGIDYAFYLDCLYDVVYTGGYALTSEEALMAEQAVLSLCNLWWKRKDHSDESMKSQGNQITNKYIQEEIPPETLLIIKQLKKVA